MGVGGSSPLVTAKTKQCSSKCVGVGMLRKVAPAEALAVKLVVLGNVGVELAHPTQHLIWVIGQTVKMSPCHGVRSEFNSRIACNWYMTPVESWTRVVYDWSRREGLCESTCSSMTRTRPRHVGVAERFSGRLKPYDNGGSIPSSHTKTRFRVGH